MTKRQRADVVELFDERLPAVFWDKIQPEPNSGCWLWTRACNSYGYPVIRYQTADLKAHRWAYQTLVGPIAEGLHIDHLCRTPCCVNPNHLEAVTPRENGRRGIKGVLTTHCPQGHAYDEQNTQIRGTRRHCKSCMHTRSANRWKREKAENKARRLISAAQRVDDGEWP